MVLVGDRAPSARRGQAGRDVVPAFRALLHLSGSEPSAGRQLRQRRVPRPSGSIRLHPRPRPALPARRHGDPLPHGRGPQQGLQGDQERVQAPAVPPPRAPDKTHQVCARHDQGSLRLRALRETSHGIAESFQRQTCPEVHQEAGRHPHPRQAQAGGAQQRPGSHEESGGEEGLSCTGCSSIKSFLTERCGGCRSGALPGIPRGCAHGALN